MNGHSKSQKHKHNTIPLHRHEYIFVFKKDTNCFAVAFETLQKNTLNILECVYRILGCLLRISGCVYERYPEGPLNSSYYLQLLKVQIVVCRLACCSI